jgi:hypothetical protein
VRVTVTPELSAFISARIASYAAEASEPYHRKEAQEVAAVAALPLIRHWFETFGLRSNGEVVRWHTDGDDPYSELRPVADRYDWLTALVEGARRYPELAVLLPCRTPDARDCECAALAMSADFKALCPKCCGLRWVSAPES